MTVLDNIEKISHQKWTCPECGHYPMIYAATYQIFCPLHRDNSDDLENDYLTPVVCEACSFIALWRVDDTCKPTLYYQQLTPELKDMVKAFHKIERGLS